MVAQDLTPASVPAPGAAPTVRLASGDEASGFATMIGDLLADNLRDFRGRRRVAARTRGDVALEAADRDIAITLSFNGGEVVVSEGAVEGAPVMSGPWLEMAKVCSGRLSPVRAVASGKLRLSRYDRPGRVAAAGFALSVPLAFYEPELAARRRRNTIWAAAGVSTAAGAAVAVAVWRRRRR